jgi:hypothetical protein
MAIKAAMDIKEGSQRDEVLTNIVSKDDVWRMAFEEAMAIPVESEERSKVLSEIMNIDGLRMLALMAAEAIDDPFTRAKMRVQAASNLPWPLRDGELEKTLSRLIGEEDKTNDENRYRKFKTLMEIVPKLPDDLK